MGKKNYKNPKFPKGHFTYFVNNIKYRLQFDKNGYLCDLQPRVGDIFNTYKGRTRVFIPEVINKIKESVAYES